MYNTNIDKKYDGGDNMKLSYECTQIIEELKSDIAEFGENAPAYGVYKETDVKIPFLDGTVKHEFLVNYLLGEDAPTVDEAEGGRVEMSTLGKLLELFEEENKIL